MIAYLMAAGNGLRLRPMTTEIQKCLLPVGGKPMLEWWLDAVFASECFDRVYVNLHHMADQVEEWLDEYQIMRNRKVLKIDERKKLLGTAGTLFYHAESNQEFMSAYTDTFSYEVFSCLPRMIDNWSREDQDMVAGLVTFESPKDGSTGNLIVNRRKTVIEFAEKRTNEGLAWSGVLFGRTDFFNYLRKEDRDLASQVLPRLVERMKVVAHVEAYDIGRGVECYEQFNRNFKKPGSISSY